MKTERAGFETKYKTRAKDENRSITGYAALYNEFSEDLGGFREIIRPGAFRSVLASDPDIRALVNHDTGRVIGRTRSGTLTLNEDDAGLAFSVDLPPTPEGNALYTSVTRGDITGASFAFNLDFEDYNVFFQGDELIREIRNFSHLYEVSVVTFPAYQATEVSARHKEHILEFRDKKPTYISDWNLIKIKLLMR